jgi:antitoxin ParD1/3/4
MYTSASEVVRAALRLMEEQDQLRAARLAQLCNDIQEGLDSGASEPWDPEATKRLARARGAPPPAGAGRPDGARPTPTESRRGHRGGLGLHRRRQSGCR